MGPVGPISASLMGSAIGSESGGIPSCHAAPTGVAILRSAGPRSTRYVLVGLSGSLALLLFYIGVVWVAQGWRHSLDQAASLWYGILPLAVGFGMQAGLFSYVRQNLRERKAASTASITVGGGVSAGSMLACCAHHISDVLPFLGIAGAAGFLVRYQSLFLLVGVISNIIGIVVMLEAVQCMGIPGAHALRRWNMTKVKKWAMVSGAGLLAAVSLVTFLL